MGTLRDGADAPSGSVNCLFKVPSPFALALPTKQRAHFCPLKTPGKESLHPGSQRGRGRRRGRCGQSPRLGRLPGSSEGGPGASTRSCHATDYLPARVESCINPLCVCAQRVQRFATPWTVAHQVALSMQFSRQEHWSGFSIPPPKDLPCPGIKPKSPALAGGLLTPAPSRSHMYSPPSFKGHTN